MTFLFLGIDAMDHKMAKEFNFDDDLPFELQEMEQDLPEVISDVGEKRDITGFWTHYVWPAIASGQIETPEMEQRHPKIDEIEFPLSYKKNLGVWIINRLKRKPRYKSFVWDDFDSVKIINYPLSIPEYKRNCNFFREDRISREYGPLEMDLLVSEINQAIIQGYDAIFAVTRLIDTVCHGANSPNNQNYKDNETWINGELDMSWNEFRNEGVTLNEENKDKNIDDELSDSEKKNSNKIANDIIDVVKDAYDHVANKIKGINWDEIDNYVVTSDHGFNYLGAGSVKAHSERASFASNFTGYPTMSQFIRRWRDDLEEVKGETSEVDEKSEEERAKDRLEELGYFS